MKIRSSFYWAILFFCLSANDLGAASHGWAIQPTANSLYNFNFLGAAGEYKTVNRLKEGQGILRGDNSSVPPTELDSNGYPLPTFNIKSPSVPVPAQAVRPGHYVATATGAGSVYAFDNTGSTTSAACTGVITSGNNCTNTTCTAAVGGIFGNTLTITVASACPLVVGQPISGAGITVNALSGGVPTIITGKSGSANCPTCTGAGGTGTYLVNFSQTVAGGTSINPGMRNELVVTGENSSTNDSTWTVGTQLPVSGNTIQNLALVHINDESTYWTGQITYPRMLDLIRAANFKVSRDLTVAIKNTANITSWNTRKPTTYISWRSPEFRSSYYIASVSYALNGASNDYSGTLGIGGPVDKQVICGQWPQTSTTTTVTFNLDGTGAIPVGSQHGAIPLFTGGINIPAQGKNFGLVFDALLNRWISTLGDQSDSCLSNSLPPEAFVQMASEAGLSNIWVVLPFLAADPITDYPIQYSNYVKSNYPNMNIIWEATNEPWNCTSGGIAQYAALKSQAYINVDATWAANTSGKTTCGGIGDIQNWTGKVASNLAQVIRPISMTWSVVSPMQTAGNAGSAWRASIQSNSYVGQSALNIPTQSGCAGTDSVQTGCPTPFQKTAAYLVGVTDISIANYWSAQFYTARTEQALAWCYYYQGAGCASQSSILTTYVGQPAVTASLSSFWSNWYAFAQNCGTGASCIPLRVRNYEGGNSVGFQSGNSSMTVTGATNALTAVLTTSSDNVNGTFVGMTVQFSAATGGTWSSIVGNSYQVLSKPTATTLEISLDSTGLGTYASGTIALPNSANYINYLRENSLTSTDVGTTTTAVYNTVASVTGPCAPAACSVVPAQLDIGRSISGTNGDAWFLWSGGIYGYFNIATCASCTISGTTLTLGGTINGVFGNGQVIFGAGVTGLGTGAGSATTIVGGCSQTGSNPGGSTAGDTCPLSQSSTVAVGVTMTGNIAPASSIDNPVKSWKAICAWNGNPGGCSWLLKRDMQEPGSANDNDPMWLEKAA